MSLYDVLGVSANADQSQIKRQFRKLALQLHPDKTRGNKVLEERFKRVNEAYQVLSDPVRRRNYDFRLSYTNYQTRPQPSKKRESKQKKQEPKPNAPHQTQYTEEQKRQWEQRRARNIKRQDRKFIRNLSVTVGSVLFLAMIGVVNGEIHNREEEEREMRFTKAQWTADSLQLAGNYEDAYYILDTLPRGYSHFETKRLDKRILDLATAEYHNEEYSTARKLFEVLIGRPELKLDNEHIEMLSTCYEKTGDYQRAMHCFWRLIMEKGDEYQYYYHLARLTRLHSQDLEQASEHYQKASELLDKLYIARFGRGYLSFSNKHIPLIEHQVFFEKGKTLYDLGNYADAKEALVWAKITFKGDHAPTLHYLGLCHQKLGNRAKGDQLIKKASQLGGLETVNAL